MTRPDARPCGADPELVERCAHAVVDVWIGRGWDEAGEVNQHLARAVACRVLREAGAPTEDDMKWAFVMGVQGGSNGLTRPGEDIMPHAERWVAEYRAKQRPAPARSGEPGEGCADQVSPHDNRAKAGDTGIARQGLNARDDVSGDTAQPTVRASHPHDGVGNTTTEPRLAFSAARSGEPAAPAAMLCQFCNADIANGPHRAWCPVIERCGPCSECGKGQDEPHVWGCVWVSDLAEMEARNADPNRWNPGFAPSGVPVVSPEEDR